MAGNPERRTALVDTGVELLAREGARGLTFRAVETEARVPVGTASNYFAHRDDLLKQIDARLHIRLAPDPDKLAEPLTLPKDRSLVAAFMNDLMARAPHDRTGHLALLEMRLEATRLPGGDKTVTVLYLAMLGLLYDLVDRIVETLFPEIWPGARGTARPAPTGPRTPVSPSRHYREALGSRHIGHI
ncbi:TetR/AcrR family transcriptional regulator [Streptomyces sp. NPDC019531]|uniref:TetR/AcrR family transcriptional regulator n=1 Tax=Streptomyces sp. NPDC019531 TaxID=3365062 RepID=UPI00384D4BF7